MIKYLDGTHETPDYRQSTHIRLYKNSLFENYPPHWHFPIEMVMPIENNYTVIVNNETYVLKPYEILFIAPGVIHSTISPPTGIRFFFQVEISWLKSITSVNQILTFMGSTSLFNKENSPDIHDSLVLLYEDICSEYLNSEEFSAGTCTELNKNLLSEPIIYSKFLEMLYLIGSNHINNVSSELGGNTKKNEYLDKIMSVCNYIDDHFADDITLDDMAQLAGFSKFHFSRLFKQVTSQTLYRYINQQRISYAEILLDDPKIPITQIAIQSGFSSSSSFIRMFKLIKNCTPSEFRRLHEQLTP